MTERSCSTPSRSRVIRRVAMAGWSWWPTITSRDGSGARSLASAVSSSIDQRSPTGSPVPQPAGGRPVSAVQAASAVAPSRSAADGVCRVRIRSDRRRCGVAAKASSPDAPGPTAPK
nr:hypothetical protein [Streptomyces sp. MA3_2.13]